METTHKMYAESCGGDCGPGGSWCDGDCDG